MKRSSWILLTAAVLLLGGGFLLLRQINKPPRPEALIRQALRDAEGAAKRRSVSGIMEIVSPRYPDRNRLRLTLVNAIQRSQGVSYEVRIDAPQIVWTPGKSDQAVVMTRVSVVDAATGENLWGGGEAPPITLVMQRETRRRWLVLVQDRWRITSIANLPSGLGFGESGAGGFLGL